jgi:hypothetical protein
MQFEFLTDIVAFGFGGGIYWAVHPNEEPAYVESCLLKEFKRIYNCLPFANLRG